MHSWLIWFVAAVTLLIAEMFTSGFWLACVAVGAAAGLVGLLPFGLAPEMIAFAAGSLLSLAGLRPALNRRFLPSGAPALRTGVDALLGRTGYVTERIAPGHRTRQSHRRRARTGAPSPSMIPSWRQGTRVL